MEKKYHVIVTFSYSSETEAKQFAHDVITHPAAICYSMEEYGKPQETPTKE